MKKRWLYRLVLTIGLLALLFGALGLDVGHADYGVSRYVVTFEVVPNNAGELRDVRTTLEITYDVRGESKSSGFKFVGTAKIENVSVTDEARQPLKFEVEHLEEERIEWSFPAVRDGQQTVVARFTIPNALQGSLERNTFSAEWVKNWKVEVDDVTYRFIFPEDYAYETVNISPSSYDERVIDGRRAIEISMDELAPISFRIAFSPGLVEGKAPPEVSGTTEKKDSGSSGSGWFWLIFILFGAGTLLWNKLSTGKWQGSGRGGGGGGCGGGGGGGCGG